MMLQSIFKNSENCLGLVHGSRTDFEGTGIFRLFPCSGKGRTLKSCYTELHGGTHRVARRNSLRDSFPLCNSVKLDFDYRDRVHLFLLLSLRLTDQFHINILF